ncbi:hypothetical protein CCR75_004404 [Bremia lactucae]|uniref:Uncharacterized protein n=1 Tax=Bremia lactucae TaxID=4779 RepID=A0A976IHG4_BRELC|nr:hypothetical protein CCR75_004404 [Bremia lactucae]
MDPLIDLASSFRPPSCQVEPTEEITLKPIELLPKDVPRPRGRPRISKTPRSAKSSSSSATHELRRLRAQVASMESKLHALQSQWTRSLPNTRLLAMAQHTASKKREVAMTEAAHETLQNRLLQQQLCLATLQTALYQSPLHSSGVDIMKKLHFGTHLGRNVNERYQILQAHRERSLSTVPSILTELTQMAVNKVAAFHTQDSSNGFDKMRPISQIDITGCQNYTLVSSVFVTEIPHASLEDVYAAAIAYHDALPTTLKRHLGIDVTRTRLNEANAPTAYWRTEVDGCALPATVNHIVCSELVPTHGMIHMDAVVNDLLFPATEKSPVEYGLSGLTLTPQNTPKMEGTAAVTLRWVVLYRYNLLPHDPVILQDLEILRPCFNGDLITASICNYIRNRQVGSR